MTRLRLYAALLKDPRHTDLKVLTRRPITRTSFETWAMKYVPLDAPMKALLRELGLQTFDPYRFDDSAVAKVLDMLGTGADLTPGHAPAGQAPTPDTAPRAPGKARWALVASVVAVAIALVAAVGMGAFG